MNFNDDDEEEINNMIEYKRLIYKLEDELKKKNSENELMVKLNDDLKKLCDNLKNECLEQNEKLLLQYEEIKNLNKKYKEEIKNINNNFDKQKIIYEDKIRQLSGYNPINQKMKIEKEVEFRYEEKIKLKENEIEILNNKIKLIQNENSDLKIENDNLRKTFKKIKFSEDKNELIDSNNDYLEEKLNNENKKDNNHIIIKELQEIIEDKEDKISSLYNELIKISNEKNVYEKNIAKKYYFKMDELKDEQNKNILLQEELNKKESDLKKICDKLINLQNLVENQSNTINILSKEKNQLIVEIENLKNDGVEELQKQLDILRDLVEKNELDCQNKEKLIQQLQQKLQKENNINSSISNKEPTNKEENIINNNDNKENEEHDINKIEEKKENEIKNDNSFNYFKIEYENIKEKCDILLGEKKLLENKIKKKEEDIEYLNNYIKDIIKNKKAYKMNFKELKYKYKNLVNKKEHYKDLCKIARKNVENIIALLTPQQKQQIEESENKYLIDTDSFSFTEIY